MHGRAGGAVAPPRPAEICVSRSHSGSDAAHPRHDPWIDRHVGSTHNISILYQQARCTNLSWALVRMRHVKHGSVVGIVGGGFSGLMLAVSLALQRRCIVYIYEKKRDLLHGFQRAPYRFISTNLNSRDLPV